MSHKNPRLTVPDLAVKIPSAGLGHQHSLLGMSGQDWRKRPARPFTNGISITPIFSLFQEINYP
jgi:hypothetical protein